MNTVNPQLKARLKRYKDNAANHYAATLKNYPNAHPDYLADAQNWRKNRYPKPAILRNGSSHTRDRNDRSTIYADSFDCLPFTHEAEAHEIDFRLPRGWYTDDYQDGILKGEVLSFRNPKKLSENDSHVFYIAATSHSDWDGVTVYTSPFFDNIEDAARYADDCARYADDCARVEAEQAREDAEAYEREQAREDAREELHAQNKATLELIQELKHVRGLPLPKTPAICAAVCQVIRHYLADRAELLKTIKGA